jgi:N-acetylglutamate synthase-like GNAT family acetyltransferase
MPSTEDKIVVRLLQERDLAAADRIVRLAFGSFLVLPEPEKFMGDAGYVRTRWKTDPAAAFVAEVDGGIAGSNFATTWGSVGFFGPLTIRPDLWDRGLGKRLMEPIVEVFAKRDVRHAGLFTFAQSQKHVGLYQRYGFWPRFLTAILSKPVQKQTSCAVRSSLFSDASASTQKSHLEACRDLTNEIYEGLDVTQEIRAVFEQNLGETVLVWDHSRLAAFAICHMGPGTEAGSGTCYIKFGAARPGDHTEQAFENLLAACEAMAADKGMSRVSGGANTARHEAYRKMLAAGFRTDFQGVAMQKPNEAGYNRPGVFLIDDWR